MATASPLPIIVPIGPTTIRAIGALIRITSVGFRISFIGDVTFYFMPFLIAANAAKVFRVNQSLALFIAGVYLSPTFVTMVAGDAAITLFGLPITKATYSYSVIPVILMVWITHYTVSYTHLTLPTTPYV